MSSCFSVYPDFFFKLSLFKLIKSCIYLEYDMEGSNKSPWSRKRKLEARMQRLQEAKINKLQPSHSTDSDASSSMAGPSEPVTESPEEPGYRYHWMTRLECPSMPPS